MVAFNGKQIQSSGSAGFPGAGAFLDLTFKYNTENGMVSYTGSQEEDNGDYYEEMPQVLSDVDTNAVNVGTYAENSGLARVVDFNS